MTAGQSSFAANFSSFYVKGIDAAGTITMNRFM